MLQRVKKGYGPRKFVRPIENTSINGRPWLNRSEIWDMLDNDLISVREIGRILGSRHKARAICNREGHPRDILDLTPKARAEIIKSASL